MKPKRFISLENSQVLLSLPVFSIRLTGDGGVGLLLRPGVVPTSGRIFDQSLRKMKLQVNISTKMFTLPIVLSFLPSK